MHTHPPTHKTTSAQSDINPGESRSRPYTPHFPSLQQSIAWTKPPQAADDSEGHELTEKAREKRNPGEKEKRRQRNRGQTDQDVVGEVAGDLVGLVLRDDQALPEQRDVLVVPGVAVRERGPVPDPSDLVPATESKSRTQTSA